MENFDPSGTVTKVSFVNLATAVWYAERHLTKLGLIILNF